MAEILRERGPLVLSGDGRCDSPGYCAKYCTYSLMDSATGLILDYSLVQVTETGSSVAMKKEGLQRGLSHVLIKLDLPIAILATDRRYAITALMKASYPNINHQFDVWHLSKSVTKRLVKVGNEKGHSDILPWIKSISNHLWWSAETCNMNSDVLLSKWTSIMHHIVNVHEWPDEHYSQCSYGQIDDRDGRKKWLKPNGRAQLALERVVMDRSLYRDIAKLNYFCHTGQLEVFHSLLTKYCPKRQHFSHIGMNMRTRLAILDHNYNVQRQQAIFKGMPRYKLEFSKRGKEWVAKPIKVKKGIQYLDFMMEQVVNPDRIAQLEQTPDVIPEHIAPIPRPDKQAAITQHKTRFGN